MLTLNTSVLLLHGLNIVSAAGRASGAKWWSLRLLSGNLPQNQVQPQTYASEQAISVPSTYSDQFSGMVRITDDGLAIAQRATGRDVADCDFEGQSRVQTVAHHARLPV